MIDPHSCRAARALLNWSQQQLANEARVGLATVKKFELGKTAPIPNNLEALREALARGGAIIIPEHEGGPGALLSRLRLRAYVPDAGLHLEMRYQDSTFDEPDNDFDLWFLVQKKTLMILGNCEITDEAAAKSVARRNELKLVAAIRNYMSGYGLLSYGGKPRMIGPEHLS